MRRYDIEVQIVREEGIEAAVAEMVTVSDLQAWALRHKATVEGMEHAAGCGYAWVEQTQPGCSVTRQDERLCDCIRGDALRAIEEIIGGS